MRNIKLQQFQVECIEDEFIQVGGSAFISDNGYIVIDAGIAATDGDSHFIGVEDGSLDQKESKQMSSFEDLRNDDRLEEDVFVSTLEPIDASWWRFKDQHTIMKIPWLRIIFDI